MSDYYFLFVAVISLPSIILTCKQCTEEQSDLGLHCLLFSPNLRVMSTIFSWFDNTGFLH